VCTGALEVLSIIEEEGLVENARVQGEFAKQAIKALGSPLIAEVRGLGLMLGIEFSADLARRAGCGQRPPSFWMTETLHEAGLLSVPAGLNAIRWLPPLNVSREEVSQAVDLLAGVLAKLV
jgi:acetylornithine/succinyldiaminopimelate/putrescine aminotransferase